MNSSFQSESQPLLPRSPSFSFHEKGSILSRLRSWIESYTAVLREFLSREEAPIIICVFALQFLFSFAKHIVEVPAIRLYEIAICNKYYRTHDIDNGNGAFIIAQDIPERLCKVAPVQETLAAVVGWKFSFDALPGLLTAIYYGSFADQFGRKPVLLLFAIGMVTSLAWIVGVCYGNEHLPVQLVWASSIFIFMGGGRRVLKSMLITIITDTVDRSQRTKYMYLLSSIPHVVTLVAPTFANLFMRVSIWLPFEAAGIILVTTVLLIWLMPESLKPQPPVANADQYPQLDGAIRNPDENDSLFPGNRVETERDQRLENAWLKVPREVLALFRIPTVPSILVMFFLKPLCFLSEGFTYQYASESFHWKISQTTWLRVSQAVGSAIVTVIILPILYVLLNHRGFQHQMLDLGVIRWSFGIAIVGFGMLWLAKVGWVLVLALFICGLSEGLDPALQGLASSVIDQSSNARIFTTIAVNETIARLIGGPLMARLFSIGRNQNHGSRGFNFLFSAVCFVLLECYSWTLG